MAQVDLSGELLCCDDEIVTKVCKDFSGQIQRAEQARRNSRRRRAMSKVRPETVSLSTSVGVPVTPIQVGVSAEWKLGRNGFSSDAEPWAIPDLCEERLRWLLDKLPPRDPSPPTDHPYWELT